MLHPRIHSEDYELQLSLYNVIQKQLKDWQTFWTSIYSCCSEEKCSFIITSESYLRRTVGVAADLTGYDWCQGLGGPVYYISASLLA